MVLLLGGRCVDAGPGPRRWCPDPNPRELVWALHVSISPSWFDPGENGGLITPFAVLYAMHDGVVRPMPGQKIGNSLAESWTESPDGLVYEFKLRWAAPQRRPCTAEDVKFSFDRYKGGGATEFRANVQRLEVVDPLTVRFYLKEPWPDFLTFYGTSATAAGLIVPKKYLEQVGDDASKSIPLALGPISSSASCRASSWCWRPTRLAQRSRTSSG